MDIDSESYLIDILAIHSMRGQASVEYLMTYGWAIFALVIVLVVLLTSGILSPNYLISEECNLGTNLQCNFALFNEGGSTRIVLEIFNGFPYPIRIDNLGLKTTDSGEYFSGFTDDVELDSGESAVYEGVLSGSAVPENTIKKFSANVTYVSCATELGPDCGEEHTITGRVTGRVMTE